MLRIYIINSRARSLRFPGASIQPGASLALTYWAVQILGFRALGF